MEKIPSFQIDHMKLEPGIYVSRVDPVGEDGFVTTFDIRMKRPNREPAIPQPAMHTLEHIIATFLRNRDGIKDELVYWGQMGCNTGFYAIVKGRRYPGEILDDIGQAFKYAFTFEGEIPGADEKSCGNAKMHDLEGAKSAAREFYTKLVTMKVSFVYPGQKEIYGGY